MKTTIAKLFAWLQIIIATTLMLSQFSCTGTPALPSGGGTVCTSPSQRCDGDYYQTCQRGAWTTSDFCSRSNEYCDPSRGCVVQQQAARDAGSTGDPPGSRSVCLPDSTRCNGSNFEVCSPGGSQWMTQAQCMPGVTRCERGVGCVPDCTPGQTRCLDRDRYQVCFDSGRGPAWGEPRMCNLSAREQCSTNTNRCSQVIDDSCEVGALSCDMSSNVYRCVNRGGVRVLEMVLNCRSEGFPGCLALPSGEARNACVTACGGRGVRLNANPGDRVSTSVCAQYECTDSRTLQPNRDDCRPVGATCSSGRQCASGRCLTDGRCGAPISP